MNFHYYYDYYFNYYLYYYYYCGYAPFFLHSDHHHSWLLKKDCSRIRFRKKLENLKNWFLHNLFTRDAKLDCRQLPWSFLWITGYILLKMLYFPMFHDLFPPLLNLHHPLIHPLSHLHLKFSFNLLKSRFCD